MKNKPTLAVVTIIGLLILIPACAIFPGQQATPTLEAPQQVVTEGPVAATEPSESDVEPEQAPARADARAADEPVLITGDFNYSNDFVLETYCVENAVSIFDMTGFILRDPKWERPVESQVLGYLEIESENNAGTFRLALPALPEGIQNDVDQNGSEDAGVQIFALAEHCNIASGPFNTGDDRDLGWPSYLASITTDTENQNEVTGGKLLIWSPDAEQQFPTGFGDDGLLFTEDDPVGPVPAGYAAIDLDQQPFEIIRQANLEMTLYEPTDVALKDFSDQSYTEAFDSMFEIVRNEYAFNGIEDKAPDWDALYDQVAPMVAEAEQSSDPNAYYLALAEFTNAFKDGHVGLDGGQYANDEFTNATGYGYGLALRELDDGSVIVTYITEGGPAEEAGIQVGDVVTEFNGEPISDAASAVEPFGGPFSTDFAKRYQQFRYLLRTGDETNDASITFKSGTAAAKTVTLSPVEERDSFSATSLFARYDPNALPVEYAVLAQQGIGYVKINSNYDDLNLIVRLFERAMKTFEANQLPGLIIDLRLNSGGSPMGLAGFLTDETIEMGQLEYYSEATGQFEPDGPREEVYPNETQYSFESMVLLVDQSCYSACEIEAYGFSQVPGMVVMGQYPSGGVEAEVARGQFLLPEGFSLQIPTGRFTLPDGSIFLEGVGVQPTIDVPIDAESVLSGEDAVLNAAIEQITGE